MSRSTDNVAIYENQHIHIMTLTELENIVTSIKKGNHISFPQALELWNHSDIEELCQAADTLRQHFMGNKIDTCSIMNARSGRCSEDCKWCSQSAHHAAKVEIYPLVSSNEAMIHARDNHSKGVGRFSLVTSGRTMSDGDIERSCKIYDDIRSECHGLRLCASMGLLNREQLAKLRQSGVESYHCNIETAPSFFGQLCSTHTFDQKRQTIRWAQQEGLKVCSGGIIGMGESDEQRIEMAFALRDLDVVSIPINVLNPIKGTPLENTPPLTDDQILRTFAIFRLINPKVYIRFAGGRTLLSPTLQARALRAGVNAAIVGDMLTTIGCTIKQDREMFAACGFEQ